MSGDELIASLRDWKPGGRLLYKGLAAAISRAIDLGDLPKDSKLPPERRLAALLGVSRSTVVAAYDLLRQAGKVERRRGSGTVVVSAPLRLTWVPEVGVGSHRRAQFRYRSDRSRSPIDMSLGALPASLEVQNAITRLQGEVTSGVLYLEGHGYSPAGVASLRSRVADDYTAMGLSTTPDEVLITSGAQQAIFLTAIACLRPGATAVIENPTYPGALDALRAVGARIAPLPVDREGADIGDLEDIAMHNEPRLMYIASSFNNPTGASLSIARREALGAISAKHNLPVIDDTALIDLGFNEAASPPTLASMAAEAPILTVGSMSKTFWGGLRIGWIRGSTAFVEDLARLKGAVDRGTPVLDQLIAASLLPHRARVAAQRREELKPRLEAILTSLSDLLPSWSWQEPAGGTSILVGLPGGSADQFAAVAYRHGVIVVPGSIFSVDGSHEGYMRLTFTVEPEQVREGVRRLATAWSEYWSRVHVHQVATQAVI